MKIRAWDESEKRFWTLQDAGESSEEGSVQYFWGDAGELVFGRVEYIDTGMGFDDVFTPFPIDYFTTFTDTIEQPVFSGDIVEVFHLYYWFKGVVKFGEHKLDGSGGEYNPIKTIGFYVEAINPDEKVRDYIRTASLFDFEKVMVIGNIYENSELLKGGKKK